MVFHYDVEYLHIQTTCRLLYTHSNFVLIDIEISEINEYSPLVYNQNIHFMINNRFQNGHYISRCVYNLVRFEFIVLASV